MAIQRRIEATLSISRLFISSSEKKQNNLSTLSTLNSTRQSYYDIIGARRGCAKGLVTTYHKQCCHHSKKLSPAKIPSFYLLYIGEGIKQHHSIFISLSNCEWKIREKGKSIYYDFFYFIDVVEVYLSFFALLDHVYVHIYTESFNWFN